MPFNGSGTFTLVSGNPVVTGSTISSTWANNSFTDFATGFTTCLTKDGQTTPTANLPMGNFKHTGAGSASASGQYLVYGQNSALLGSVNITGTQTMTGAVANIAAEVDVASATATDIGGAASNSIRITGTTQIDGFGTTYTGPRFLRFAGILQLTNSSTLVLPGGANITTAAGDTCIALPLPSSAGWYVSVYTPISGAPIVNNAIPKSTVTTAGDLIYATGSAVVTRLGIGTAGQVLKTNSGVTAPEWGNTVVLGTPISTTGGTAISFTGLPAGVRELSVNVAGMSTSGTSPILIQIGDSGGYENSGYTSQGGDYAGDTTSTAGFIVTVPVAASAHQFCFTIRLIDAATNLFAGDGCCAGSTLFSSAGSKALSATLDRVQITMANGTDTFDALTYANISYKQ